MTGYFLLVTILLCLENRLQSLSHSPREYTGYQNIYYSSTPCASSDVPNLYVEASTLLYHTWENVDEVVPLHAMRKYEGGKV